MFTPPKRVFGQNGEAYRWRVCYQRGLPHLVSEINGIFSKHRPSGPMLSIIQNVRLRVRLSVRLFNFEVPFKRLFAPTSRSWMSNIFRDSESLGKSM